MSNSYFNDFEPTVPTFGKGENGDLVELQNALVRSKESGDKIYVIKGGFKHWVTSPEVLSALGFAFGQEKFVERQVLQELKSGEPIKMGNVDQFKTLVLSEAGAPPLEASMPVDNDTEAEEGVITVPAHPEKEEIVYHTIIEGLTSIIIPAYFNSYQMIHLTGDCIGNIREYTDKSKTPYEIVLVSNGKLPPDLEFAKQYVDKIIENEENLGFAKAVNQGIRVSQGEFIVIMNDDVKVFDHWLEDFKEALQFKDLVTATPMYALGNPWKRAVEAREFREANMDSQKALNDFEDFSCVIMKRTVLETIGLFDEGFFYSCEDVDFKERMKKAGLTYASSKKISTHHVGSATDIPRKAEIMNESKAKFKEKWEKDSV